MAIRRAFENLRKEVIAVLIDYDGVHTDLCPGQCINLRGRSLGAVGATGAGASLLIFILWLVGGFVVSLVDVYRNQRNGLPSGPQAIVRGESQDFASSSKSALLQGTVSQARSPASAKQPDAMASPNELRPDATIESWAGRLPKWGAVMPNAAGKNNSVHQESEWHRFNGPHEAAGKWKDRLPPWGNTRQNPASRDSSIHPRSGWHSFGQSAQGAND